MKKFSNKLKKKPIAFIPARANSKRIKNKNIIDFYGHPLIAYSISAAIKSNIFSRVICVTDSHQYAKIAKYYGAEVPSLRPKSTSKETSPDIEWVKWILKKIDPKKEIKIFSILRPTNPFRTQETIKRAYKIFVKENNLDSLRAIEVCKQHPGKMWFFNGEYINPIFPLQDSRLPLHSSQMASLPTIYVQNASLEIAWTKTVYDTGSIAGLKIKPFFSKGYEGIDINNNEDLLLIEKLIENKQVSLSKIDKISWFQS